MVVHRSRNHQLCGFALRAFVFCSWVPSLLNAQQVASVISSTPGTPKPSCISSEFKNALSHVHHDAHANRSLTIKLQTSDRPSQQLISNILKILIHDVFGYENIELVYGSNTFNTSVALDAVAGLTPWGAPAREPPDMVNVEMWMQPLFQIDKWDGHNKAEYLGPLGPVGKFGWFVSSSYADEQFRKLGLNVDWWTDYKLDDVARLFDLRREPTYNSLRESARNAKACSSVQKCNEGIYFSPSCARNTVATYNNEEPCAFLLAANYTDESARAIRQIESHGLKVAVMFLGNQLETFIRAREVRRQPSLFFGYDPSVITSQWSFRPVLFRPCTPDETDDDCDFTVNQLSKAASAQLRHKASDIFALLHKMSVVQDDYNILLRRYSSKPQVERNDYLSSDEWSQQVACEWIKNSTNRWLPWVTSNETKRLLIGGIFPLYSETFSQGDPCWGVSLEIAARIAVEGVNSNKSILHGSELSMYSCNGACATAESLYCYVNNRQQKDLVGIVGSACSDAIEPLLGFGKYSRTMMVSYGAEASGLSDRHKYPYFYRTTPDNLQYGPVYASILREVGWSRVGAVSEDGQKYPEYLTAFQKFFSKLHIEYSSYKIPRGARTTQQISDVIKQIKSENMRIIIADFFEEQARAVMCAAYRANMTASDGYVWFLPNWFSGTWYKTSDQADNMSMCTTEEMVAAINHHFTLEYSYFESQDATKTVAGYTVSEFRARLAEKVAKADYDKDRCPKGILQHKYVAYAHDAVWAIALALDKLASDSDGTVPVEQLSKSDDVARKYSKFLGELEFQGVSGFIAFNGSNRIGDIIVRQRVWNKHNMSQEPVEEVIGRYETKPRALTAIADKPQVMPSTSTADGGGLSNNGANSMSTTYAAAGPTGLMLSQNNIKWGTPNRRKPSDGGIGYCLLEPIRAVLGFTCERTWLVTVIIAIILGTIFSVTVMCCLVIRFSYTRKLKSEQDTRKRWQMRIGGDILSLTEWEMPRANIHPNRKLGHGAFGVVYGGEAVLLKKSRAGEPGVASEVETNTPVNVAIKTLYQNAAPSERLDFLAEAEVMKRLNHENIIKLYGVCTEGRGPFSIVVEFMLYGDMKTYLLGRRDKAINEPDDEVTLLEVGAEKLTTFARDITCGLQYLHSERLVHRDLAARNCLVSAERRVKLSDFGLCRPIYESGYYRFTRKAMMPVRWMSPESLDDGVFSPASDTWGLGVVFFEITTLGGFPFPGKNNAQVLDFVKKGGRLSPPEKCPPVLSNLMTQTWDFDPLKRPSTAAILKLLTEYPSLFCACVQAPAAVGNEAINPDGHENVGASVTGAPSGGALSLKHTHKSYPAAAEHERVESGHQPSSSGRMLTPSGGVGRPGLMTQRSEPVHPRNQTSQTAATRAMMRMLDVSVDTFLPSRAGGTTDSSTTTSSSGKKQQLLTPTAHSRAQDRRRTVPEDRRSQSPRAARETNATHKLPLLVYRRDLSDDAFIGSDQDEDDDADGEYLQIADENMTNDTVSALLPNAVSNIGGGDSNVGWSGYRQISAANAAELSMMNRNAVEASQPVQNWREFTAERTGRQYANEAAKHVGGAGDADRINLSRFIEQQMPHFTSPYSSKYNDDADIAEQSIDYSGNHQNVADGASVAARQPVMITTNNAVSDASTRTTYDTASNNTVLAYPSLQYVQNASYHDAFTVGSVANEPPLHPEPVLTAPRSSEADSVGAITLAHRRILEQMNRKSLGGEEFHDESAALQQLLPSARSSTSNYAGSTSTQPLLSSDDNSFDLLRSSRLPPNQQHVRSYGIMAAGAVPPGAGSQSNRPAQLADRFQQLNHQQSSPLSFLPMQAIGGSGDATTADFNRTSPRKVDLQQAGADREQHRA